jgi:hypothetical protein
MIKGRGGEGQEASGRERKEEEGTGGKGWHGVNPPKTNPVYG